MNEYIDVNMDVHEAADILTSTGLEVEKVEKAEPIPGMLEGVVVGKVLSCTQHPNADKLKLTQVDIGGEENLPIVCGAPNVAEGQKVLVATVGCTLYPTGGEAFKIKKAKIRGEESRGMICAEDELGLGTDHDGIMVLDDTAEIGMSAALHLDLKSEYVLEIGLTPNRADGMSHLGAARDLIAAINHRQERNAKLLKPSVEAYSKDNDELSISCELANSKACPRYSGVGLTEVRVGPSPKWLQDRLMSIGMKPINNVVDITNFVQMETGQPLHAFDAARIGGGKVVVRNMDEGTLFVTLDEVERKLSAEDLMICDAEKGMCIGGVFGGIDSGVSEATKSVFLESAIFDPSTIRRTNKRHGLHTDAGFRFERGVDPDGNIYALKRAALLIKELCGAKISSYIVDIYPEPIKGFKVELRYQMLDRMMGHRMNREEVKNILPLLDITIESESENGLKLHVPAYRVDVQREIDVIEEIMRIHGFDRVIMPERLNVPMITSGQLAGEQLNADISAHLSSRGFCEIMTPSLVSAEDALKGGSVKEEDLVRLSNPLSTELDVMRSDMIAGGLDAIAYNINRRNSDLRLFERGRVYERSDQKHVEKQRISILMSGKLDLQIWRADARSAELDDVKSEIEMILDRFEIHGSSVQATDHPLLNNAHRILIGEKEIGLLGSVDPSFAKRFDVDQEVHFGELYMEALVKIRKRRKLEFETVSKYPAVRRDLSMLLDKEVRFEDLKRIAEKNERKLLKHVTLFDSFEGDKLPDGKKSYCLTFTLQDENQTLTDDRIEKVVEKLFRIYEKEFAAERR